MAVAIRWTPANAYVRSLRSNRRPYTALISDAQQWVSRKNAHNFLDRKDPQWASQCEIVEVEEA